MSLLISLFLFSQSSATINNSDLKNSLVIGEAKNCTIVQNNSDPVLPDCVRNWERSAKGESEQRNRAAQAERRVDREVQRRQQAEGRASAAERDRDRLVRDNDQKQLRIQDLEAALNRSDGQDSQAVQLLREGRYKEGIELFEEAISEGNESVRRQAARHSIIGRAILAAAPGDDALDHFEKAYELDKTQPFYALDYVRALKRKQLYRAASELLV
jgi:tetratricopeptide (TPR) repeat protein